MAAAAEWDAGVGKGALGGGSAARACQPSVCLSRERAAHLAPGRLGASILGHRAALARAADLRGRGMDGRAGKGSGWRAAAPAALLPVALRLPALALAPACPPGKRHRGPACLQVGVRVARQATRQLTSLRRAATSRTATAPAEQTTPTQPLTKKAGVRVAQAGRSQQVHLQAPAGHGCQSSALSRHKGGGRQRWASGGGGGDSMTETDAAAPCGCECQPMSVLRGTAMVGQGRPDSAEQQQQPAERRPGP